MIHFLQAEHKVKPRISLGLQKGPKCRFFPYQMRGTSFNTPGNEIFCDSSHRGRSCGLFFVHNSRKSAFLTNFLVLQNFTENRPNADQTSHMFFHHFFHTSEYLLSNFWGKWAIFDIIRDESIIYVSERLQVLKKFILNFTLSRVCMVCAWIFLTGFR